MALGDKQADKVLGLAQAQISEPVILAGVVSPKGRQGARALGGLAGMAIHSASKSKSAFGPYNVLAVTDSGLHAFSASNNVGVKLKDPIGSWPWGSFGASTADGSMTRFLFLQWGDGSVDELEQPKRGVGKAGTLIDEIVRRAVAAGMAAPPPPPA